MSQIQENKSIHDRICKINTFYSLQILGLEKRTAVLFYLVYFFEMKLVKCRCSVTYAHFAPVIYEWNSCEQLHTLRPSNSMYSVYQQKKSNANNAIVGVSKAAKVAN
jgi:hypothetical protein